MRELCPDALLINYANPMAMNCWYLDRARHRGPSASATASRAPPGCWPATSTSRTRRCSFLGAGINHQAWFLRFRRGRRGPLPAPARGDGAHARRQRRCAAWSATTATTATPTAASTSTRARTERVRTETDGGLRLLPHRVEPPRLGVPALLPQERRARRRSTSPSAGTTTRSAPPTTTGTRPTQLLDELKSRADALASSTAPCIVNAMETGRADASIYGNVPNRGLITNLPDGCCVEAPCIRPMPPASSARSARRLRANDQCRAGRTRPVSGRTSTTSGSTPSRQGARSRRSMIDDLFASDGRMATLTSDAAVGARISRHSPRGRRHHSPLPRTENWS